MYLLVGRVHVCRLPWFRQVYDLVTGPRGWMTRQERDPTASRRGTSFQWVERSEWRQMASCRLSAEFCAGSRGGPV